MTKATVLIVDDEPLIRDDVSTFLTNAGYQVYRAECTAQADRILVQSTVDLILLDVVMPGEDGISFCKRHMENADTAILMLSSRDAVEDRISGLRSGADDYLPKPFDPAELLARVESVLRRRQTPTASIDTPIRALGPNKVDFDQETVSDENGVVAPLSRSETLVLRHLLSKQGETVSREDLVQALYGRENRPFERTIDNIVVRLRRKVEEDPANPIWIKTVWGAGYRVPLNREDDHVR